MRWQVKKIEETWECCRWEFKKAKESEMDELDLLVHSVRRTWARFRKRYFCWRLICVWRKWREHRGRNHPADRKRPVEVMVGVEAEGVHSCLVACSTNWNTHQPKHVHSADFRSMFPSVSCRRNTVCSSSKVSGEKTHMHLELPGSWCKYLYI